MLDRLGDLFQGDQMIQFLTHIYDGPDGGLGLLLAFIIVVVGSMELIKAVIRKIK